MSQRTFGERNALSLEFDVGEEEMEESRNRRVDGEKNRKEAKEMRDGESEGETIWLKTEN